MKVEDCVRPSTKDFNEKYPRNPINDDRKQQLFDLIREPKHMRNAITFVDSTQRPPLQHYGKVLENVIQAHVLEPLDDNEKTLAGKMVCLIMEFNGFNNKSTKRPGIKDGIFGSGALFIRN